MSDTGKIIGLIKALSCGCGGSVLVVHEVEGALDVSNNPNDNPNPTT